MRQSKYFMSCVVAFPVSEAVVETWGSVIDKVISSKIDFKESTSIEMVDITEQIAFLKLVGSTIGATSDRRLFKRALTLMYNVKDYPKHYMLLYELFFSNPVYFCVYNVIIIIIIIIIIISGP